MSLQNCAFNLSFCGLISLRVTFVLWNILDEGKWIIKTIFYIEKDHDKHFSVFYFLFFVFVF